MRNARGDDLQWVLFHDTAWQALVEQGYITAYTEYRGAQHWALMRKAQ